MCRYWNIKICLNSCLHVLFCRFGFLEMSQIKFTEIAATGQHSNKHFVNIFVTKYFKLSLIQLAEKSSIGQHSNKHFVNIFVTKYFELSLIQLAEKSPIGQHSYEHFVNILPLNFWAVTYSISRNIACRATFK